jgi:hypothetical protein
MVGFNNIYGGTPLSILTGLSLLHHQGLGDGAESEARQGDVRGVRRSIADTGSGDPAPGQVLEMSKS